MYITMGVTKSKENGCISVNFKIKRMNDHVNCKVKNELLCKFANQKQIVGDTSSKVYGNFRYMDKYIFWNISGVKWRINLVKLVKLTGVNTWWWFECLWVHYHVKTF